MPDTDREPPAPAAAVVDPTPEVRCQLCGAVPGAPEIARCPACGEPVLRGGWAP